jgi:hypothetical protein
VCRERLFGCRCDLGVMNDRYVLLLEPDTFINLIHEKFGVETFDAHSVSKAVDSSNSIVLLTISVVNFNGLPLRTGVNPCYSSQCVTGVKSAASEHLELTERVFSQVECLSVARSVDIRRLQGHAPKEEIHI